MKRSLILAISIAAAANASSVQASTIYCVNDWGLNDSQFCYGTPLPFPPILPLDHPIFGAVVYEDCDIEGLDIHHETDELYASSGDDTPRPGHLYYVYKDGPNQGDIIDLGKIDGLREIDTISFHPITGDLWGWAQGQGLFFISETDVPFPPFPPFPPGVPILPEVNIENPICLPPEPEVPVIPAKLVLSGPPIEVEDITWNWEGNVLYAVENVHGDVSGDECVPHGVDSHGEDESGWPGPPYDFDFDECDIDGDGVVEGIRLWAYDDDEKNIVEMCPNLAPSIAARLGSPAEIEALEALPEGLLPGVDPVLEDLLLVGFHGPREMLYAVIVTPPLPLTEPLDCDIIWLDDIPTDPFGDIEGLAYSPNDNEPE